jgi:hypothetical protein
MNRDNIKTSMIIFYRLWLKNAKADFFNNKSQRVTFAQNSKRLIAQLGFIGQTTSSGQTIRKESRKS